MKTFFALLLVVVALFCAGCADNGRPLTTQPPLNTQDNETLGSSIPGIRYVDGELVVDWITDALAVEWENQVFEFSTWLENEADYSIAQLSEMRVLTMVTTTQDEKLQAAARSIEVSYPLCDDEQIKRYVYALEGILHEYGYMEEELVPQLQAYEFGPCVASCYTDGVLAIYFHILPPLAPYVRDATGPTVFVSMESGEVLFIAYAL